jgi:acetyltransferase-like isoleucine patch superfamily enzyme
MPGARAMLIISDSARISPLADIEDSVRGTKITIEDGVVIDAFVKIKPVGGNGDLHIASGSFINSGCVLYTGNGLKIGRNCLIAANCTFAPTNHEYRDPAVPIVRQGFMRSRGGVVLGDDVWIGANSVILDGATIGEGCVVGAGSVVRDSLPPFSICFGVPATVRGKRC